jgi:hypothetical protein
MKKTQISKKLKDQCRGGNIAAIREYLDISFNNSMIDLRNEKEGFQHRQGYLQALEDVADLFI